MQMIYVLLRKLNIVFSGCEIVKPCPQTLSLMVDQLLGIRSLVKILAAQDFSDRVLCVMQPCHDLPMLNLQLKLVSQKDFHTE